MYLPRTKFSIRNEEISLTHLEKELLVWSVKMKIRNQNVLSKWAMIVHYLNLCVLTILRPLVQIRTDISTSTIFGFNSLIDTKVELRYLPSRLVTLG